MPIITGMIQNISIKMDVIKEKDEIPPLLEKMDVCFIKTRMC